MDRPRRHEEWLPRMPGAFPESESAPLGPTRSLGSDDSVSSLQENSDLYVAVMGTTGAGKSTFISHCTREEVRIGHDMESCESGPGPSSFLL